MYEGVILEKFKSVEEVWRVIWGYMWLLVIMVGLILVINLVIGVWVGGVDKVEVYFNVILEEVIEVFVEEGSVFYFVGGLLVEYLLVLFLVEVMVGSMDSVMGMLKEFVKLFIL